jgi:hypothetical protein
MPNSALNPVARWRSVRILGSSAASPHLGEGAMPRGTLIVWTTTAVMLALGGCTPTDDTPAPSPSTSAPSSSPVDSSPRTTRVPSYLRPYTPRERNAYEAAVLNRNQFAKRQSHLYSRGEATQSARRFYQKYTASWPSYWGRLRQFDSQGIRVSGRSEVLRIRPTQISVERGSGSIVLKVCGDGASVKVTQRGAPVRQPKREASLVRVAMVKLAGDNWWRVLYERPLERRC